MAESIVQVTEGSGKKLHTFNRTIGANSVEDEVVLQGEPYLASYIVTTGTNAASLATAATHLLQLMAGASLKVRVRRIEVWQAVLATTAAIDDFTIVRLTTAGTGGTVTTPAPLEIADGASSAVGMRVPTAKGTEAASIALASAYIMQTAGASTPQVEPIIVWDFDKPRTKPLIIAAGATNGIAVKNGTARAGASVYINIWFDETNF